jgi:hypothetical protein
MAWKVGNSGKVLLLNLEVQLYPYILLFAKLSKIEGKGKMVLKYSKNKFNFKQNSIEFGQKIVFWQVFLITNILETCAK